jgi:hypothetical protein
VLAYHPGCMPLLKLKGGKLMDIMIREYDDNNELLRDTDVENFDEAIDFCKKSNSKTVDMFFTNNDEMCSVRGIKNENGHIDWKKIEN